MTASEALSGAQFPLHSKGVYQPPIPGLPGHGKTPIESIFRHPQIAQMHNEYSIVNHSGSHMQTVQTKALRPTQDHLDDAYLQKPNSGGYDYPGAIKDGSGRYRLVDGHHKVARALLNGEKTMNVRVWHAPR